MGSSSPTPREKQFTAVDTGDTKPAAASKALKVDGINQKIAAFLRVAVTRFDFDDVTVNPISHNIDDAVISRGCGPEAIPGCARRPTARSKWAPLDKADFLARRVARMRPSKASLARAIARAIRAANRLLILRFSRTACSSPDCRTKSSPLTLRAIPFPFKDGGDGHKRGNVSRRTWPFRDALTCAHVRFIRRRTHAGVKDANKIRAFIRTARAADAALSAPPLSLGEGTVVQGNGK